MRDDDGLDDSEQLTRRQKLDRDPAYGDWLYEQMRDKELIKEMDGGKKKCIMEALDKAMDYIRGERPDPASLDF